MKRRKTFEITSDGQHLYRPFASFGPTYELPDRASFDRMKIFNYGFIVVVFLVAGANIVHKNPFITIGIMLGLIAVFFLWLSAKKSAWKKID